MPKKLLVMGDSNSGGLYNALTGLQPPGQAGHPEGLLMSGWTVINEARGGESSVSGVSRITDVVANGPYDAALVCYGAVDFLNEILNTPPGANGMIAIPNMHAIFNALVAGGTPAGRIYLAEGVGCLLKIDPAIPQTLIDSRRFRAGYFALGHCLRTTLGQKLSYSMPQDDRYWNTYDCIHLTSLGYEVLAHRVINYLRADGLNI